MPKIDGCTRLAGVVGTPLGHSLSPAMHNAAFETMGLDWVYVPLEICDGIGLRRFAAAARSLKIAGFNVTMPFKSEMLELCDEVATAARMASAVNTVHCVDGQLIGYNTDGRGLLESLETEAQFRPADTDVVVLGNGGAAAAAVVALILARAARVTVVARDVSRAEALVARMAENAGTVALAALGIAEAAEAIGSAQLVVNATSVGLKDPDESPIPGGWLAEGQVVYDMVYGTPGPTALVRDARLAGARAFDGLGMLVAQGALALEIWEGLGQQRAPREVMRAAAEQALASRRTIECERAES